jgi:hypothetical protein
VKFEEAVGRRVVANLDIPCPAGEPVGEVLAGSGCYCRVTHSVIASATDPSSLGRFCTSADGYRLCPVWRSDNERRVAA